MILQKFESAEAIARFLRHAGVKGRRRGAHECPIALYVKRLYPNAAAVCAGTSAVTVWFNESNERPSFFEIKNTEAMDAFIQNFDHGHYPHLMHV